MKKVLGIAIVLLLILVGCGEEEQSKSTDDLKQEIEDLKQEQIDINKERNDNNGSEDKVPDTNDDDSTAGVEEEDEATNDESDDGTQSEVSIEQKIKTIAAEYQTTTISDIKVNEDLGTGEGYIALVYLSFDAKNKSGTAKDMIDMYSNDLGANLASEDEVNEVTVFWEVPYLQEGDNIVKYNMQREGEGMAIENEWFDPSIF